jgi:hypothetical protein
MPRNKFSNEAITALQSKVAELNKQIREESQNLLNVEFTKVFEKYPKLNSFTWNQYTPYFNDGDECTFHVNPDSLIPDFSDESGEDHDYEYDKGDSKWDKVSKKYIDLPVSDEKKLNNEAYDEIYSTIAAIDNDTMKAIYGDHVEVTVSKKADGSLKVATEEHEHE